MTGLSESEAGLQTEGGSLPFGWRILGGAGAGVLLAASFPPYNVPFLLPFGVAALLALLTGVTLRQAIYIGAACGAVYFGGTLFWLALIFGPAAITLIAIQAVYIITFAALFTTLRRRLPRVPAWLLAPVVWTAVEYLRSEGFLLPFGWMGLGYGVAAAPLPALCASWLGSYGLTFGIVLLAALPAFSRSIVLRAAILVGWILLLMFPTAVPTPSRPLNVRLVQAAAEDTETMLRLSHGVRPVDIIVWPEYSFVRDLTGDRKTWRQLEQTARDNHAVLVFGGEDQTGVEDTNQYRNTAFVLGPDGRLLGKHVKNHLVHFFKDGVRGREARAIPSPAGRLGVAICFDMDYPDVARRLAADGAELFVVPNMDPVEWGPVQRAQHRLMFQMRAAECGRWLARADVAGGTSVAAPSGREMARVRTSGPTALEARVGRAAGQTLYVRGGWRFPQACVLAFLLFCLWALMDSYGSNNNRRTRKE